jgi:hypothetical protein
MYYFFTIYTSLRFRTKTFIYIVRTREDRAEGGKNDSYCVMAQIARKS